MLPSEVNETGRKGYVIKYICAKCGQSHNNKAAEDDNFATILKVMNKTYNFENYKKK